MPKSIGSVGRLERFQGLKKDFPSFIFGTDFFINGCEQVVLFMLSSRELETMTKDERVLKPISYFMQTDLIKEMILSKCQEENMTWMCAGSYEQKQLSRLCWIN